MWYGVLIPFRNATRIAYHRLGEGTQYAEFNSWSLHENKNRVRSCMCSLGFRANEVNLRLEQIKLRGYPQIFPFLPFCRKLFRDFETCAFKAKMSNLIRYCIRCERSTMGLPLLMVDNRPYCYRCAKIIVPQLAHISQIVIDVENEIYILENVILRGEYSK
jgi:hypothetical protein